MLACQGGANPKVDTPTAPMQSNAELAQIFEEDQGDRNVSNIDWSVVLPRDDKRRARVAEILKEGGAKVSADFHHAAMVYQHGHNPADFQRAHELAAKAVELDPSNDSAKWLGAAAKDRYLMNTGKPQLYGTQFRTVDGVWELYEVDPSVTDADRAQWNVPPLAEAQKRAETLNKQ